MRRRAGWIIGGLLLLALPGTTGVPASADCYVYGRGPDGGGPSAISRRLDGRAAAIGIQVDPSVPSDGRWFDPLEEHGRFGARGDCDVDLRAALNGGPATLAVEALQRDAGMLDSEASLALPLLDTGRLELAVSGTTGFVREPEQAWGEHRSLGSTMALPALDVSMDAAWEQRRLNDRQVDRWQLGVAAAGLPLRDGSAELGYAFEEAEPAGEAGDTERRARLEFGLDLGGLSLAAFDAVEPGAGQSYGVQLRTNLPEGPAFSPSRLGIKMRSSPGEAPSPRQWQAGVDLGWRWPAGSLALGALHRSETQGRELSLACTIEPLDGLPVGLDAVLIDDPAALTSRLFARTGFRF